MADYTPTFDPRLSGLAPKRLLLIARINRNIASRRGINALACSRRADRFEFEAEERWLASGPPWVAIFTDGNIGALGSKRAYLTFVGAGR